MALDKYTVRNSILDHMTNTCDCLEFYFTPTPVLIRRLKVGNKTPPLWSAHSIMGQVTLAHSDVRTVVLRYKQRSSTFAENQEVWTMFEHKQTKMVIISMKTGKVTAPMCPMEVHALIFPWLVLQYIGVH